MELIKPLQSTAVRFLRIKPTEVFIPDIVQGIKDRYRFWEAPLSLAEWNQDTGARFAVGKFRDANIGTLQIFANGIVTQGDTNTSVLDDMISDAMVWAQESFGLEFIVSQPIEKNFNSTVEVRVSTDILNKFKQLESARNLLSKFVKDLGFPVVDYTLNGITLQSEANELNPIPTNKFVFERRVGPKQEENLFFSEAPTTTDQHIELLQVLEHSF